MIRLMRADLRRLGKSTSFYMGILVMLILAFLFMIMQATAMDYTVPLSRVIFLPLSMYAVVMAAMISVLIGNDFNDGFIRNKLLISQSRRAMVLSYFFVSSVGCVCSYIFTTVFSSGIGRFFFENDIVPETFVRYFLIGIPMSISVACLFSFISILCGNKTRAVICCMGMAFVLLFLCMHTNEVLMQSKLKNGALNPHYITGVRRGIIEFLHDFNPSGQAAQLSAWNVLSTVRSLACSMLIVLITTILGCLLFEKQDIQ